MLLCLCGELFIMVAPAQISCRSETYRPHTMMLKYTLESMGLLPRIESVCTDIEVGIGKVMQATFPEVHLKGCRFHYSQAVWRMAEQKFGRS